MTEQPIARTVRLEHYRPLDVAPGEIDRLESLARAVATRLGSGCVWMLNSTARGGGVAEMMPRLASLLNDLGIHTRWIVLETDEPAFFRATKQLHNLLHGRPGAACYLSGLGAGDSGSAASDSICAADFRATATETIST